MKILLLGSNGMAGHLCYNYFVNKGYEVFGTNRDLDSKNKIFLDIFNLNDLSNKLNKIKPNVIINCIGILVSESMKSPKNAIFVNSFLPHYLDEFCSKNSTYLIHLSTDCVFSGKNGPYNKNSFKDENNYYGLSKNIGEVISDSTLTIRTSIIGPEIKSNGIGLFHWFMNQGGKIEGYSNVLWSGVTTLFLANFIESILFDKPKGLINLSNNKSISKLDLLQLIKNTWDLDIEIIKCEKKKINKTLINGDLDIGLSVQSYSEMLLDLKGYMELNKSIYKNFYSCF